MSLVIVESPSKSKTLEKYLGKDYHVVASMGHIRDLPKSDLGVDVEKGFLEVYEIPASKKKTVSALKKLVKEADKVFLATDPDREGEAISWHLMQVLSEPAKKSKGDKRLDSCHEMLGATPPSVQIPPRGTGAFLRQLPAPFFQRVVFHEITKDAVLEAFKHPRSIDMPLVDAQRARRVLDRLVGYKLSPLLWKKIRYGLSAGRVQSVAVRFVVERQKEIDGFKSFKYYEVEVLLDNALNAKLTHISDRSMYTKKKYALFAGEYSTTQTLINDENTLHIIKKDLEEALYKVLSIEEKEYQKAPRPPFTTSSLQQESSWKLNFSPKKTMSCAQKLYEKGLITYMRTDSTNMSSQALDAIRQLIREKYGQDYLPEAPKFYKTTVKVAQEAHEAIRPTNIKVLEPQEKIDEDGLKLYEIIWQRAMSCQMTNAVYSGVNVKISASKGSSNYTLSVKDSVLKFPGWTILNKQPLPAGPVIGSSQKVLPDRPVLSGTPSATDTRYLNLSNEKAIGTASASISSVPATRMAIGNLTVGKLLHFVSLNAQEKQTPPPPYYNEASLIKELEKFGIGRPSTYAPIMSTIQDRGYVQKMEGKLKPTDSGVVVTKLLTDNFSDIMDINFTAKMEDDLDEIALAKKDYVSVINDFYGPFEKLLNEKQDAIDKSSYTVLETLDEKCPKCQSPLIVKLGKYGKFISCGAYPKCDYLRPIVETTGIKCPKCKAGDVIVRRTKKGKTFYGCSNYPKCDFAVWKLEDVFKKV